MFGVHYISILILLITWISPFLIYAETGTSNATKCLGAGDPKNDFYVKDLEEKIKRVQDIPREIDALKEENKQIDEKIKKIEEEISGAEYLNSKMSDVQNRFLSDKSKQLDKKYADWKTSAQKKLKDQTEKIKNEKKIKVDTVIEKARIDTSNENERYRVLFNGLVRVHDLKNAELLSIYKIKIKQNEDIYNEIMAKLRDSIDQDISGQLAAASQRVMQMSLEHADWKKRQQEMINEKRRNATSFELIAELKKIEEEFKRIDKEKKDQIDVEVAKIEPLPKVIQAKGTSRILPDLNRAYLDRLSKNSEAKRIFDNQILENANAHKAQADREKAIHLSKNNDIEVKKNSDIALIEEKAASAIRNNQDLYDRLEKETRDKFSRELANIALGFEIKDRAVAALLKLKHEEIENLKIKQLENITKYTEILPAELEKLKFIKLWTEESSIFKTQAGVCAGDCERRPTKASFQVSSKNIDQDCIDKAIAGKVAYNTQIKCSDSSSPRQDTKDLCIDKKLSDYIGWSLNKAIDCLSGPFNTIDTQLTYIKLANESTFRPFYSYRGGHGLVQTIQDSQNEMLGFNRSGTRATGRKFLAETMARSSNRHLCEKYKNIFNYDAEYALDTMPPQQRGKFINSYPEYNQRLFTPGEQFACQFISLEEGIHRNILNGLGLYLYYKDGYFDTNKDGANEGSADDALKRIGITKRNRDYNRIKEYFTLAMYGPRGPGGTISRISTNINKMLTVTKKSGEQIIKNPDSLTFEEFRRNAIELFPYLSAIDDTQKQIAERTNNGERLKCATKYY